MYKPPPPPTMPPCPIDPNAIYCVNTKDGGLHIGLISSIKLFGQLNVRIIDHEHNPSREYFVPISEVSGIERDIIP